MIREPNEIKVNDVVLLVGTPYRGKVVAITRDTDGQQLYAVEMPHHAITDGGLDPIEHVSRALIKLTALETNS